MKKNEISIKTPYISNVTLTNSYRPKHLWYQNNLNFFFSKKQVLSSLFSLKTVNNVLYWMVIVKLKHITCVILMTSLSLNLLCLLMVWTITCFVLDDRNNRVIFETMFYYYYYYYYYGE
jgi:hypothetical protein